MPLAATRANRPTWLDIGDRGLRLIDVCSFAGNFLLFKRMALIAVSGVFRARRGAHSVPTLLQISFTDNFKPP